MLRKTSKHRAVPNRNGHIPSDVHRTQSAAQPPRYQSAHPLQIVYIFFNLKIGGLLV